MRRLFCLLISLAIVSIVHGQAPTTQSIITTIEVPHSLTKFEMIKIEPKDGQAFWIGKTEVTWDLYDIWAFQLDVAQDQQAAGVDAESRPSKPYGAPDRGFGHNGFPAMGMTFHAAQEFCNWLSKQTGATYRLPTEAEWEAACASYAEPVPVQDVAWVKENANRKTHAVASKRSNAHGLHDTLGNVAEWCVTEDGSGVVRGGSYNDPAASVSCETRATQTTRWNHRDPQDPKSKWWLSDAPFVGFRIVRED